MSCTKGHMQHVGYMLYVQAVVYNQK